MTALPGTDEADARLRDFLDGEFPFTLRDFTQLAEMLRADAGIVLDEGKMPLVYSRLSRRLRALGLKTFKTYYAFVSSEAGADERHRMVEALTTNVTRFFREAHHFEHLKTDVLPRLLADAREGARLRLWSAGCSSGEEPYSIALTLLAMMPDAAEFDIKVLATDIDADILQRGKDGVYSEAAVAPISAALRSRWLIPAGRDAGGEIWQVGQDLRALVSFREANLIGEWPMRGPFDVIFCRNTVIYFDDDTRVQIWNQMASRLSPGGHLYIGHSERMPVEAGCFQIVGLTTYRLGSGPTP